MVTESGRPRRRLGPARVALLTFVAFELAIVPLLVHWGRKWWFWADDWDFLADRTGGSLGDLFRPHYQHWTTLPSSRTGCCGRCSASARTSRTSSC